MYPNKNRDIQEVNQEPGNKHVLKPAILLRVVI